MRYLLDTCVVMNMIAEPDRLYVRQLNEATGHKDPSEHVIISQAITEHLPLVSSDTRFPFYREQGLDLIENR